MSVGGFEGLDAGFCIFISEFTDISSNVVVSDRRNYSVHQFGVKNQPDET